MVIKSITEDKWMALNKHGALSPLGECDLPAWVNFGWEPASFSWFDHGIPIEKIFNIYYPILQEIQVL